VSRDHDEFVARLEEIAATAGDKASLARRAGLSPTTLQNYFSQESEPSRPILISLARAAGVSLSWLAAGIGEKHGGDAPEGYLWVACYDLAVAGPFLRGMVGVPGARLLARRSELEKAQPSSLNVFAVAGAEGLEFPPEIRADDAIIVEWPRERNPLQPSLVKSWEVRDGRVYLVADGTALKLRKLRQRKGSVIVIDAAGKEERVLTGAPTDFVSFGPVIWRSGAMPPPGK
jgi:Helix-turn-helix